MEVRGEPSNIVNYTFFEFSFTPCNDFREVDECYKEDEIDEYWKNTRPLIGMNFLYK